MVFSEDPCGICGYSRKATVKVIKKLEVERDEYKACKQYWYGEYMELYTLFKKIMDMNYDDFLFYARVEARNYMRDHPHES